MAADVKQLELTRLSEELAGVHHQLSVTQQVTLTLLCAVRAMRVGHVLCLNDIIVREVVFVS